MYMQATYKTMSFIPVDHRQTQCSGSVSTAYTFITQDTQVSHPQCSSYFPSHCDEISHKTKEERYSPSVLSVHEGGKAW